MPDPAKMPKWLFAALLVFAAHCSASYLVPLDAQAQQTFAGLLKWFWPWADGDSGPLGVTTVSSGFPLSGFFLGVSSAALFLLAALAVLNLRVPFRWWRASSLAGAVLSLFLMVMFLGAKKLLPLAMDGLLLWAAWKNRAPGRDAVTGAAPHFF